MELLVLLLVSAVTAGADKDLSRLHARRLESDPPVGLNRKHLIECYDLSQNPPVPKDGGPCGPGSKGICADGDCVVCDAVCFRWNVAQKKCVPDDSVRCGFQDQAFCFGGTCRKCRECEHFNPTQAACVPDNKVPCNNRNGVCLGGICRFKATGCNAPGFAGCPSCKTCQTDGTCHTDPAASCTTGAGYAGSCSTGVCVATGCNAPGFAGCPSCKTCQTDGTCHTDPAASCTTGAGYAGSCSTGACVATGCNALIASQTGSACNFCQTCLACGTCRTNILLANGGFEVGFNTFTVLTTTDYGNWYIQTGTASPLRHYVVPAPPQGDFAAMTDQKQHGTHILYFKHTVHSADQVLSFRYYVHNWAAAFYTPATFSNALVENFFNQQALVYISAKPPSVDTYPADDDIIFRTEAGSPLNTGVYAQLSASLAAYHQQTIYVAFAEVDNQQHLNFGIDDIQITCGAPVTE